MGEAWLQKALHKRLGMGSFIAVFRFAPRTAMAAWACQKCLNEEAHLLHARAWRPRFPLSVRRPQAGSLPPAVPCPRRRKIDSKPGPPSTRCA
jgi:hypothetical protein